MDIRVDGVRRGSSVRVRGCSGHPVAWGKEYTHRHALTLLVPCTGMLIPNPFSFSVATRNVVRKSAFYKHALSHVKFKHLNQPCLYYG